MTKTIHKWFWAWKYEEEAAWLNDMAQQGWALCGVGFCTYHFEPCQPGQYQYCIELLENVVSSSASQEYIAFLEDTGVTYIANYFRWAYFRRETSDSPFELFSDNKEKIRHLNRILCLFLPVFIINLSCGLNPANALWPINMILAIIIAIGMINIHKVKESFKSDGDIFE